MALIMMKISGRKTLGAFPAAVLSACLLYGHAYNDKNNLHVSPLSEIP